MQLSPIPNGATSPSSPTNGTPTSATAAAVSSDDTTPMTQPILMAFHTVVRNLKRHKDANPFLLPVDPIKLKIPDYPNVISNPMDISTIEKKMVENQYSTVGEWVGDFELMFKNCLRYNGTESPFSKMAMNLEKAMVNHVKKVLAKKKKNLPNEEVSSPSKSITTTSSEVMNNGSDTTVNADTTAGEAKENDVASPSSPGKATPDTERTVNNEKMVAETNKGNENAATMDIDGEAGKDELTTNVETNSEQPKSDEAPVTNAQESTPPKSAASEAAVDDVTETAEVEDAAKDGMRGEKTDDKSESMEVSTTTEAGDYSNPSSLPPIQTASKTSPPSATSTMPTPSPLPKRKRTHKLTDDLRFCGLILKELVKKQHQSITYPFMSPVDVTMYPSYPSYVNTPMDFGTMKKKLDGGEYKDKEDFWDDAMLVFRNCYTYNPEGSPVNAMGQKVQALVVSKWGERFKVPRDLPAPGSSTPAGSVRKRRRKPLTDSEDEKKTVKREREKEREIEAASSSSDSGGEIPEALRPQINMLRTSMAIISSQLDEIEAQFPSSRRKSKSKPKSKSSSSGKVSSKGSSRKKSNPNLAITSTPGVGGVGGIFPWFPPSGIMYPGVFPPFQMPPPSSAGTPVTPGVPNQQQIQTPTTTKPPKQKKKPSKPIKSNNSQGSGKHKNDHKEGGKVGSSFHAPPPNGTDISSIPSSAAPEEVTYEMKRELADSMQKLSDEQLGHVFQIIHSSLPHLAEESSPEIELDIDSLDPNTLQQLYKYVKKCLGDNGRIMYGQQPNAGKRKGLSVEEQDRKIQELESQLSQLDNHPDPKRPKLDHVTTASDVYADLQFNSATAPPVGSNGLDMQTPTAPLNPGLPMDLNPTLTHSVHTVNPVLPQVNQAPAAMMTEDDKLVTAGTLATTEADEKKKESSSSSSSSEDSDSGSGDSS